MFENTLKEVSNSTSKYSEGSQQKGNGEWMVFLFHWVSSVTPFSPIFPHLLTAFKNLEIGLKLKKKWKYGNHLQILLLNKPFLSFLTWFLYIFAVFIKDKNSLALVLSFPLFWARLNSWILSFYLFPLSSPLHIF